MCEIVLPIIDTSLGGGTAESSSGLIAQETGISAKHCLSIRISHSDNSITHSLPLIRFPKIDSPTMQDHYGILREYLPVLRGHSSQLIFNLGQGKPYVVKIPRDIYVQA